MDNSVIVMRNFNAYFLGNERSKQTKITSQYKM